MAREVPQKEWSEFLTDFTNDNGGRQATIEVEGKTIGRASGEAVYVLTGVEAGVQAEDEDTVVVTLADMEGEEQGHVSHRFEDVSALRVFEEEGETEGLEIETRDGNRACVHLAGEIPTTG